MDFKAGNYFETGTVMADILINAMGPIVPVYEDEDLIPVMASVASTLTALI